MFSLRLKAVLDSFHVEVCDDSRSIADITVQGEYHSLAASATDTTMVATTDCFRPTGMDASVMMQAKETEVFARLRNIVVMDANSQSLHRKVTFTP